MKNVIFMTVVFSTVALMSGGATGQSLSATFEAAIGAAYYLRIIMAVYMGDEVDRAEPTGGAPVRWALALCSAAMLVVFVWPTGLADRARSATVVLHQSVLRNAGKMAATESEAKTIPPLASRRLLNAVLPVASD